MYDLQAEVVRVDSTTASGYVSVMEEGLFQFGHSKAPARLAPGESDAIAPGSLWHAAGNAGGVGEKADDRLYIPSIQQVRQGLKKRGVLYVGDCKLMSLANRAYLQEGGDCYLGPFSKVQFSDEALEAQLQAVWSGQQALTPHLSHQR